MDDERKRAVAAGYEALAEDYLAARSRDGPGRELAGSLAADLPAGSLVLDAGCGAGVPASEELARRHEVVGLDAARAQLELFAERVPAARPLRGDLTRLPLAAGAVDAVVCYHALIHVPRTEHGATLAEFRRVLPEGGRLLVTVGTEPWEGTNPDWLETGVEMSWSFHGRERSLELLAAAGFAVEDETVRDDALGGSFLFVDARAE